MGDSVQKWTAFTLKAGSEFYGTNISANKHPGLDGTVSPYADEVVSSNKASFMMKLQYEPLIFKLADKTELSLGLEGIFSYSPTSQGNTTETIKYDPGDLFSLGIGAVVGIEHYLDNGVSFGLDLSVGYRHFWANGVDLGAIGPNKDLRLNTFALGIEGSVKYKGFGPFVGLGVLANHYNSKDGLTDETIYRPRAGIGDINNNASLMISAGLLYSF